ncbi:DEAD/DEAH box helicase [Synechococcus sp. FGCU-3]|nr:DEAD/DEAH box helicase [Synechococcus sp. FGCU3]
MAASQSLVTSATPFQSKYWATQLALRSAGGSINHLSGAIFNARVDLNPHQVDAALFAVRSPFSKGVILADEVGLGKTIEAGLVLSQYWAERRRRILVIVPATLRKQWAQELEEKFHLPAVVLDATSSKKIVKAGQANPFQQDDRIVVCSYHFAANRSAAVTGYPWDLVVIDEAHRLRNVYKKSNKMAQTLMQALRPYSKVMLTATPLQNSLMELYGLVSFIDPHIFGDQLSFREQFVLTDNEDSRNAELRLRLLPVCQRTLRRQVLEYIKFTQRIPLTWEFHPSEAEQKLYEGVSTYLQREVLYALPNAQRTLMTMVLRKLLASSSFAIAKTLRGLLDRLQKKRAAVASAGAVAEDGDTSWIPDYESFGETSDEWEGDEVVATPPEEDDSVSDAELLDEEIRELEGFVALAETINWNAKGDALVEALAAAFPKAAALGGAQKAVVFTESQRTQSYLFELLEQSGYEGKVVILNGDNKDERSKLIYKQWLERHQGQDFITGSQAVDVKAAIVEEFRDRSTILVATEAAAEGVNLQFCSLVVNYDLPWNPQRIEQRIGRCHRYGQKHDVVVVNFLNQKNAADQRVYELIAEKFHLFDGVFGASDQVLGALESGVDIERRIAEIYQDCRSQDAITEAFSQLQLDLEQQIQDRLQETRQFVLEHFDEEVQERLKVHRDKARAALDERGRRLLALARQELGGEAEFSATEAGFTYRPSGPPLGPTGHYLFDWKEAEERGAHFFRTDHPLAQQLIETAMARPLDCSEVVFDYEAYGAPVAILAERQAQSGWLRATKITVKGVDTEEHLLVAAIADAGLKGESTGEALDAHWCDRLLNLPASVGQVTTISEESSEQLETLLAQQHAAKLAEIEARNSEYFEEEVDKLDRWADDMKLALEHDIKQLNTEIKAAKKDAKTKVVLAEKLEAQKRIKSLEQQLHSKRRQLFDAQDEIDNQRSKLIDDIERQLQTSADRDTLFTVRWQLPQVSSY